MKRTTVLGLVLSVGIVLTPALLAGGNADAGKAVYDKKCAACHGPEGEGKASMAKVLKVELRHLGSKDVQAKSDDELRKDTVEGIGKMKSVKGLSDDEVANVIAYIRTLKQK